MKGIANRQNTLLGRKLFVQPPRPAAKAPQKKTPPDEERHPWRRREVHPLVGISPDARPFPRKPKKPNV